MIGRVTICIAMAVCSVIPAFAQMSVAERLDDNRPLIAAWRSVSGGFPEGTLAGIRHALEHGVDMIDLHVQRTGDGRHIVFHDAYLNRMTDVQTVYPEGTPGGPSRAARGGRDYLGDYTLDDLRALSLLVDGAASEHPIPTLEEALDLIDGRALAVLTLQAFDREGLVALLAARETGHLLVYSVDPNIVRDIAETTGVAGYAAIHRSRVSDMTDTMSVFETARDTIGGHLLAAHVRHLQDLTSELMARAEVYGIALSVSGHSPEDTALAETGDAGPWREALAAGADIYWTSLPARVVAIRDE